MFWSWKRVDFLIFNILFRRQIESLRMGKPIQFCLWMKIGAHTYLGLTPQEDTGCLSISPSENAFPRGMKVCDLFIPKLCPHSDKWLLPTSGGLPLPQYGSGWVLNHTFISPPPPLERDSNPGLANHSSPLPGHSDWPRHKHMIQAGPIQVLSWDFKADSEKSQLSSASVLALGMLFAA